MSEILTVFLIMITINHETRATQQTSYAGTYESRLACWNAGEAIKAVIAANSPHYDTVFQCLDAKFGEERSALSP